MNSENDIQKTLGEILGTLKGLDNRIANLERDKETSKEEADFSPLTEKKTSIKEFLMKLTPSDDVQKTLAIGYFLESHEDMDSFNTSDLEKAYRLAKEQVPKNINDKVNLSIKKGHIMEAEEKKNNKKAWVLTSSGEQFIQNGFKKEASSK